MMSLFHGHGQVSFLRISFLLALNVGFRGVTAGICWLSVGRNGRCRQIYSFNTTRAACCNMNIPSTGWTPHRNPSRATMFYWAALTGGAPQCHRCHTNCDNITCSRDRKCRVRRGKARCVCSPRCPRALKNMGSVCGTNGQNFKNYCTILRYNCRHNQEVSIAYLGICKKSCSHVKCFESRKYCIEDQNGLPHCVQCNINCRKPARDSAMCGEDGKTYPSYCHLVAAVCIKGKAIRVAYSGSCKANATCNTIPCPLGYKCIVNRTSGFPQCANCMFQCRSTPGGLSVCGSDGVTYSSYCQMQHVSCETGVVIRTKRFGTCEDASTVKRFPEKSKRRRGPLFFGFNTRQNNS